MAYVNGNLAMQPKRKQEPRPQFRETKKVVVKRKSLPMQEKLLYMFTILACVIVAGVIIFRYAQIYQMELEVKKLSNQHVELTEQIAYLTSEYEKAKDPAYIREQAKKQGLELDENPIKVSLAEPKASEASGKE
ncbi:septum formation initiator family protein [Paenibacillus montanisoli]|uniref:Cell division initiation protein n=1 Tax=Paenibacillus montanisoli TaxID=2081970 RepID=A0A328U4C5_9BACL|nr:septum formation initiator family protein [Paenibacillus montanisoli]RAP76663.1 cell division initiation protein [Paenibacillus montanisoli]